MRTVRLLEQRAAPVESTPPLNRDTQCKRCMRHDGTKSVCLGADGTPGGLLVVLDRPSPADDAHGRPLSGAQGHWLRSEIGKWWGGPVVIDYAVRCKSGGTVEDKEVDQCRGYLAAIVAEAKPTRILCIGTQAIYAVLGRSPTSSSVPRGYAWLASGVPVLMLPSQLALENKFLKQRFFADLAWCLSVTDAELRATVDPGLSALFVETAEDAREIEAEARRAALVGLDCEWAGDQFDLDFTLLTVAIACDSMAGPVVWDLKALADPAVRAPLAALMSDPTVPKTGHTVKSDLQALRLGLLVRARGLVSDVSLARRAEESEMMTRLEYLQELVGLGGSKSAAKVAVQQVAAKVRLKKRGKAPAAAQTALSLGAQECTIYKHALSEFAFPAHAEKIRTGHREAESYAYSLIPPEVRDPYCALDAWSAMRATKLIVPRLLPGPARVLRELDVPALEAVEQVEAWGIAVDVHQAAAMSAAIDTELAPVLAELKATADINWDSNDQLAKVLFTQLKLPVLEKTETGQPSTEKEVLQQYDHPAVTALLRKRHLEKQQQYAELFPKWVRSDGRIHPVIKIGGARTGRLSVVDPELHQIPRDTGSPEGKMARDCIVAPPGRQIVSIDQSQLELRVAAGKSGDKKMLACFKEGRDLHLETAKSLAQLVWKKDPSEITKKGDERSQTKSILFALLYGQGAAGLAKRIGLTVQMASSIRDGILRTYPQFANWSTAQERAVERTGYVWTWWRGELGRRRDLHYVAGKDSKRAGNARRSAVNSPVQGEGSDICLRALVRVVNWITGDGLQDDAMLTFSWHDALISEVADGFVDEYAVEVVRLMEDYDVGCPLKADVKVGTRLGSMAEWKGAV